MKKAQAIKFWGNLEDSTEIKEIISAFENKKGYAGKRTLERYVQAYNGFTREQTVEEVSKKTGWKVEYVRKIYGWWYSDFGSFMPRSQFENETKRSDSDTIGSITETVEQNEHSGSSPSSIDDSASSEEICEASPDAMDVDLLKTWGIKSGVASQVLAAWRECHQAGLHDICPLYRNMAADLKSGMPVNVAKKVLRLAFKSRSQSLKHADDVIELCRRYRSWEGNENHEAFMSVDSQGK